MGHVEVWKEQTSKSDALAKAGVIYWTGGLNSLRNQ